MKELKLINLEDVKPVEVQWLWKPYLPKGKVSILRGHPGEGESMFMMALISALTNTPSAEGEGIRSQQYPLLRG